MGSNLRFATFAVISYLGSTRWWLRFRQPSEQYFTSAQTFSHFLRQLNGRPQTTQVFSGKSDFLRILGMDDFFGKPSPAKPVGLRCSGAGGGLRRTTVGADFGGARLDRDNFGWAEAGEVFYL